MMHVNLMLYVMKINACMDGARQRSNNDKLRCRSQISDLRRVDIPHSITNQSIIIKIKKMERRLLACICTA